MKLKLLLTLLMVVMGLATSDTAKAQQPEQGSDRVETRPWNAPMMPKAGPPKPPAVQRPGLFFREEWKAPSGGLKDSFSDSCCWALTEASLSNPDLALQKFGTVQEISLVGTAGDNTNPIHAFTGLCSAPCGLSFKDRNNYVDLTHGKVRWVAKTAGFHAVRPMVRLSDGTYLVGDFGEGSGLDFRLAEFNPVELRWIHMDPERVITYGNWIARPDLTKVDEVGWVDLLPGSGHNQGGYDDVADMEVYGRPVPRTQAGASSAAK